MGLQAKAKKRKQNDQYTDVRNDRNSDAKNYKLEVLGFPYETDENELRNFFATCGGVETVILSEEREGTAVVAFSSKESSDKAMELDGEYIGSRWVRIREYRDRSPRARPDGCTTVFCGNLSFDIDEETLRDFFNGCGDIKSIRWGMDKDSGEFKGYGHVEFYDENGPQEAVKLNQKALLGRKIRLDYAVPSSRKQQGLKNKQEYGKKRDFGDRKKPQGFVKKAKLTSEFKGSKITFD